MFDVGDGGLGNQLAMYRLVDSAKAFARQKREVNLSLYADRLAADNRQLVAYAERLERELKVRDEQLAALQATLADTRARLADEMEWAKMARLARLDRAKQQEQERDRERAARSQQV